jgi:hypothetical protein
MRPGENAQRRAHGVGSAGPAASDGVRTSSPRAATCASLRKSSSFTGSNATRSPGASSAASRRRWSQRAAGVRPMTFSPQGVSLEHASHARGDADRSGGNLHSRGFPAGERQRDKAARAETRSYRHDG